VPNVSLHVSSGNAVFDSAGSTDAAVIYSSGSMLLKGTGDYDLKISSGIQFVTTTTGIKWADGSISTTAAPITVAAAPVGPVVFLSSQSFTAASSFSVGLNVSNYSYVLCTCNVVWNTLAGAPVIFFNNDTAANHYKTCAAGDSAAGHSANCISSTSGQATLNSIGVGSTGYFSFSYMPTSSGSQTPWFGMAGYFNSANNQEVDTLSTTWTNATSPSYVTVQATSGAMTGHIKCTYLNY
jgi:hypothetical protein